MYGMQELEFIKYMGEEAWSVESDTVVGKRYKVTLHCCDCKSFEFGNGKPCKHMDRLMAWLAGEDKTLVQLLEQSIEKTHKVKLFYES